MNNELELFLQWYTSSGQEPNITKLAQAGLPSGRGQKGGVSKRKQSRKLVHAPDVVVSRPVVASCSTSVVSAVGVMDTPTTLSNKNPSSCVMGMSPTILSIGNYNSPASISPTALSIRNYNSPASISLTTLSIGNYNAQASIMGIFSTTLSIGNYNLPASVMGTSATTLSSRNPPASVIGTSATTLSSGNPQLVWVRLLQLSLLGTPQLVWVHLLQLSLLGAPQLAVTWVRLLQLSLLGTPS